MVPWVHDFRLEIESSDISVERIYDNETGLLCTVDCWHISSDLISLILLTSSYCIRSFYSILLLVMSYSQWSIVSLQISIMKSIKSQLSILCVCDFLGRHELLKLNIFSVCCSCFFKFFILPAPVIRNFG